MAYSVPTTFAGESGNQPATQLDGNFSALVTGVNNAFLVGTLGARPAPDGIGNGRYYFATDVVTLYRDNGTSWVQVAAPASGAQVLTDELTGLALSNDGGTPLTVLDIAVGAAASDDAVIVNRILMSLTSAYTKNMNAAWAVGTGNGGLASGASLGATTWYHVFLIERVDTGVVDVMGDTSVTGANIPANYTKKRRLGAFRTDGASHILAFTQVADYVRWAASVLDVNTTNPGVAAVTATLTVPTGVTVQAIVMAQRDPQSSTGQLYLSDLAANDEAPSKTAAPLFAIGASGVDTDATGPLVIGTNTSAQIRYRTNVSGANDTVRIATLGWWDRRGRG